MTEPDKDSTVRTYPCDFKGCDTMRNREEGGNIFTVCDKHWLAAVLAAKRPRDWFGDDR